MNKLLAGILIGGMTTTSVAGSALPVFAAETDSIEGASKAAAGAEEGGSEQGSSGSESSGSEQGASGSESSGSEQGSSGSESSGSESSGSEQGASGSESSGSEQGSSGSESSGSESSGSESSGSESSGSESSGSESSGSEYSGGESQGASSSGEASGSGSESQGGTSEGSSESATGETTDPGTPSLPETGSEESAAPAETPEETEEADDLDYSAVEAKEGIASMDEEEDSGIGQSLVGASSSSKSSSVIVNSAEDAKRIQAANAMEARARKEAEEEAAGIVARSYGYAFSNRDYYTGSYFITEAQKRLALNIGFKQVGKVYAMPRTGVTINIREGGSLDDRIVGKLDKDGVCYVLEDDGKDWIFVESGEVRGFVFRDILDIGEPAEARAEEIGEENLVTADQEVDPLENTAFRHTLNTTKEVNSIVNQLGSANADRQAMLDFAEQFLGLPYVWGGDSLSTGADCSGFTQQVYAQFGISLPRCSYEQAEVGVKIPAQEALPGDLLFYARNGVVYHVMMYIGDGKVINESSSTTGCVIYDVDYSKVCWACRYIADDRTIAESAGVDLSELEDMEGVEASSTSLQAADLQAVGLKAFQGDADAQEQIINALAAASEREYESYGFARSVIIAQAINETGWLSFPGNGAGILASDNNVLGMNAELNNSEWTSPWNGRSATRMVPQYRNGGIDYGFESMRLYDCVEDCMEDYAAFKISLNPQLAGENDVDKVIGIGLKGYASDPAYQSNIKNLIDKYNLTRFDEQTEDEEEKKAEDAKDAAAENAETNTENPVPADTEAVVPENNTEPVDGEVPDAEVPDAEVPDAEVPDAEVPDAEIPDGEVPEDVMIPDGEVPVDDTVPEGEPAEGEDSAEQAAEGETEAEASSEAETAEEPAGSDAAEEVPEAEASESKDAEEETADSEAVEDGAVEEAEEAEADEDSVKTGIPAEDVPAAEYYEPEVVEEVEVGTEVAVEEEPAEEVIDDSEAEPAEELEDGSEVVEAEEGEIGYEVEEGEIGYEVSEGEDIGEEVPDGEVADTADSTYYTMEQKQLIYAIVAEEDDTSYDGALAVISTAMNRADKNYGGFGTTALSQLTAESQYRYSSDVDPSGHYRNRLKGNVPDFVIRACDDCLNNGIRNTDCDSLSETKPAEGPSKQIGINYYYNS